MKMPKPWYREDRKSWFVQIGNRQFRLGPDEKRAKDQYLRLMLRYRPDTQFAEDTIACLAARFLTWCETHQAEGTLEFYRQSLDPDSKRSFTAWIGPRFRAYDLKPYMVDRWIDENFPNSGDTHRNSLYRGPERLMNWANRKGYLDYNPIAGKLDKPTPDTNEKYITEAQYTTLLPLINSQQFKDFFQVLFLSGARPEELRAVKKPMVKDHKFVFAVKRSKGKRKSRCIILNDTAWEIVKRLAKENGSKGAIFRNLKDRPWKLEALTAQFRKLSKTSGIKVTSYMLRKGYATALANKNVNAVTLARLMGHTSTKMLVAVYNQQTSTDLLSAVQLLG